MLVCNVYFRQLIEVHIEIFQFVILRQVYRRNLVVCGIVRITFAIQISHVTVDFHLRTLCCSIDECPFCRGSIFFQLTISPVYSHRSIGIVGTDAVCAFLSEWHGQRNTPFTVRSFEHSLYVSIRSYGEESVLNEFSIDHYALVFFSFLGSVAHAKD